MKIHNTPLNSALKVIKKEQIKKIISIYSPNNSFPLFPEVKATNILRLCFNDIDHSRDNLKPVSQRDIRKILKFAMGSHQNTDILIHCYAGVSRSIAISIIIYFMHNRNIRPSDLYSLIMKKAPFANPNKLVLKQAGRVLKEEQFFQELVKNFTQKKRTFGSVAFYLNF
tara:strand:- start:72956 stop:73462 length:507 start_codon:yes stop_codon:yes gene_type:complete